MAQVRIAFKVVDEFSPTDARRAWQRRGESIISVKLIIEGEGFYEIINFINVIGIAFKLPT
jgi:hypothetical protein